MKFGTVILISFLSVSAFAGSETEETLKVLKTNCREAVFNALGDYLDSVSEKSVVTRGQFLDIAFSDEFSTEKDNALRACDKIEALVQKEIQKK